ncbi:DUF5343 domain-containing protein [Agarivorans sp. 1_MG-2023]|uniref:DUF5343 domain-containing protein n=1 Tax=Agarivorans sp. 1_MG-2023 TaxID=3062634 RepID=UPI0026E2508E|nr:DUF5343 domain-containing protein [Agarivorans sp. 1_MG-2023]MDO6765143.1 DUF5343 domain-containing protein [Agarivorans sp. 1_MG-2023]
MANLPYAQGAGTLETMLNKIKTASVPDNFSPDFVSTKLLMKGGSGRAIIPFIKKMGLVSADGTPTERYKQIRNPNKFAPAIADAIREVYETLFEMNEYVYELEAAELKALVVEATGAEPGSTPVKKVVSTFQALCSMADFEIVENNSEETTEVEQDEIKTSPVIQPVYQHTHQQSAPKNEGINLSYTINLNLPATTDIEVFNAIFKSLKTHLMQE